MYLELYRFLWRYLSKVGTPCKSLLKVLSYFRAQGKSRRNARLVIELLMRKRKGSLRERQEATGKKNYRNRKKERGGKFFWKISVQEKRKKSPFDSFSSRKRFPAGMLLKFLLVIFFLLVFPEFLFVSVSFQRSQKSSTWTLSVLIKLIPTFYFCLLKKATLGTRVIRHAWEVSECFSLHFLWTHVILSQSVVTCS